MTTDSYVQLPADGAGKDVETQTRTGDDGAGTAVILHQQVVSVRNQYGQSDGDTNEAILHQLRVISGALVLLLGEYGVDADEQTLVELGD